MCISFHAKERTKIADKVSKKNNQIGVKMEEKIKKEDLQESKHVSSEDVELRKFCVEKAINISDRSGASIIECAKTIEEYITGKVSNPDKEIRLGQRNNITPMDVEVLEGQIVGHSCPFAEQRIKIID
jgi:hypothetical protein